MTEKEVNDLIERLRKRAFIRRSIPRGEPDRIANDLEEAGLALEELYEHIKVLRRNI